MVTRLKELPDDMQVLITDLLMATGIAEEQIEKTIKSAKFQIRGRRTPEFPKVGFGGAGDNRDAAHALKCPLDPKHPIVLWSDIDDPEWGSYWLDGRHRLIRAQNTPGNTHVWTIDLGEHFPTVPEIIKKTAIAYIPSKFKTARTQAKMPHPPENFRRLSLIEQQQIAQASTCDGKLHPEHCFLYFGDILQSDPELIHRKACACPDDVLNWHAELLPERTLRECIRAARKAALVSAWDVMNQDLRKLLKKEASPEMFINNRTDLLDPQQIQKLIEEMPGKVFQHVKVCRTLKKRIFHALCRRSPMNALRAEAIQPLIPDKLFSELVRMAPAVALIHNQERLERPEILFCLELLPVPTLENIGDRITDDDIKNLLCHHEHDNSLIQAFIEGKETVIYRMAPLLEFLQQSNPRVAGALAEEMAKRI
jgi:hypothetical protein